MNKNYFLSDFQRFLDEFCEYDSEILTQRQIRNELRNIKEFPMICFEYSDDSIFESTIWDSKFLNDESYDGVWLSIEDVCLICFNKNSFDVKSREIILDVFEINENYRNRGYAHDILETLEFCVKKYNCDYIKVSPYDSMSESFWRHMGYNELFNNNNLVKKIF